MSVYPLFFTMFLEDFRGQPLCHPLQAFKGNSMNIGENVILTRSRTFVNLRYTNNFVSHVFAHHLTLDVSKPLILRTVARLGHRKKCMAYLKLGLCSLLLVSDGRQNIQRKLGVSRTEKLNGDASKWLKWR